MKRPACAVILFVAGWMSIVAAGVYAVAVAVSCVVMARSVMCPLLPPWSIAPPASVMEIVSLVASGVQCLVGYAVCASLVWLIDAHSARALSSDDAQPLTRRQMRAFK